MAPPHILATDTRKGLIFPSRTLGFTTPGILVCPVSLLSTNIWVDTYEFRQFCLAPSLPVSLAFPTCGHGHVFLSPKALASSICGPWSMPVLSSPVWSLA